MLDIRVNEGSGIFLTGRLDAAQAPRLAQLLDKVSGSQVLDLAGLDYISSAGIGVLVKTQLRLQENGCRLQLANVQPRVRAVLHFAGLEQFFAIE